MSSESFELPIIIQRVANRICRPIGVNPFPRAFPNLLLKSETSAAKVFDEVYRQNYWGSEQSRSGVGSETAFTLRYRIALTKFLAKNHFSRIFDAPCGDLNWMSQVIEDTGINYMGGDISLSVVEDARSRHANLNLQVFDITTDSFPNVDVWHCRDCLFHLPLSAIRQALTNFAESSVPYALITSHRARFLHRNLDVGFGGFRFLDLEWLPVSLPTPIARLPDFTPGHDFPRYVCLWSRKQITGAISEWKD